MKRRIVELLHTRDMAPSHADTLPKLGVITSVGKEPIAAAFLRRVEGTTDTAILDSIISSSAFSPQDRDKALDQTIHMLFALAQAHKITHILGFSTDKNTLMRGQRFGFAELPHQVVTLSLPQS